VTRPDTIVIVGASLSGAKAAEALREDGFEGRIVLLGEEAERPYERPPLSKGYLRGEAGREKIYVHDEGFYAAHDIELRTSTPVTALEPGASEVVLGSGERLRYDRLLLATGAAPRRLGIPGADLPGVRYLRSVEDSDALADAIRAAGRVVVVGAGWIGAEVAASARQMGREVAMIERASVPLERVLGTEVGGVYRDLHADHGVELLPGTVVESFQGSEGVEAVRTADGRTVSGDLVVVGVGVAPRVELAEAAGLALDNGVAVDEYLETSVPGIYAAGDVAAAWHPLFSTRVRVEHWANALNQGPAAARNMLDKRQPYERVPYFFSDQYDLGMEYSGYAPTWDEVVYRGNPKAREFVAFWLKDGRVVAGMNANVWDVAEPIQALIRSQHPVDINRLADPDVSLEDLAGETSSADQ
jgi:3-phenylpropionate/trans-cinnamate dioxygenase ferredoxin reductase subunit